ncbi:hypothetical protein LJB86_04070 [Deltaproteobacteria bacterium OttesenSCG-928-M10]|nr:hypothetical protein [Deltaproteobacteria bacterium OttesenSCG-928-M10]
MSKHNNYPEQSLEVLTTQAVSLATELSLALDKQERDSHPSICQIRDLAILSLNNVSKIVVLLLDKGNAPH